MSELPPPPPTSLPPLPPPAAMHQASAGPVLPTWRSSSVGWVILNIVIGLAIGFGVFIAVAIALGAGHFDTQAASDMLRASRNVATLTPEVQRLIAGVFGALVLAVASGLIGWLLFVYLKVRAVVRTSLLVAIPLIALLISYGMMAAVFPKLPGY